MLPNSPQSLREAALSGTALIAEGSPLHRRPQSRGGQSGAGGRARDGHRHRAVTALTSPCPDPAALGEVSVPEQRRGTGRRRRGICRQRLRCGEGEREGGGGGGEGDRTASALPEEIIRGGGEGD